MTAYLYTEEEGFVKCAVWVQHRAWAIAAISLLVGGTGIIFGLDPAKAAAQLDPIEALRHE